MSTTLWMIALALLILLLGGAVIWVLNRRTVSEQGALPPPGVAQMGYGTQRWEREIALWRGTLHRLEIQAKYQNPIPESLQRQLGEARAKLAEAEQNAARQKV